MKPAPLIAMAVLIFLGMWLVLQPALRRGEYDFLVRVGSMELLVDDLGQGKMQFVHPPDLAAMGPLDNEQYRAVIEDRLNGWMSRPRWQRTLLGFFNISEWSNFIWVAVGLLGQGAFFGRMLVQWIVSEKHRRSEVPVLFWWFSLVGGFCLFAYFVWRVDIVGVLGQSTGLVIYGRNLRLIQKERDALASGE